MALGVDDAVVGRAAASTTSAGTGVEVDSTISDASPVGPAAEVQLVDVDAGVAEDRADHADHPGHVVVAHDEHVARRRQVDDVVVDGDDARGVLLAVERARDVRGPRSRCARGARSRFT